MRKFQKILSVIESDDGNEVKAKKIEKMLNSAIRVVVDDYFEELKSRNLLNDESKAKSVKDVLLGQSEMQDYPRL